MAPESSTKAMNSARPTWVRLRRQLSATVAVGKRCPRTSARCLSRIVRERQLFQQR
jgi:hypothetical protein